jgi:hypothetical protein
MKRNIKELFFYKIINYIFFNQSQYFKLYWINMEEHGLVY